ncbi:MAG: hypothetical protein WA118_08715 [Carboxydocellales bacterium]
MGNVYKHSVAYDPESQTITAIKYNRLTNAISVSEEITSQCLSVVATYLVETGKTSIETEFGVLTLNEASHE